MQLPAAVTTFVALIECQLGLIACPDLTSSTAPGSVPDYVLQYAPIVYLHSTETFFPAPLADVLQHTQPSFAGQPARITPPELTLNTLAGLDANSNSSTRVTLSSTSNITQYPSWFHGVAPSSSGRVAGSPSSAIITHDAGNSTVFAFYMFWYPFNLGLYQIGNHVGDWEHFALRFDAGTPTQAWYSQHASGTAYAYAALEKDPASARPVVYSANGTHANYAAVGSQPVLGGLATDLTDKGLRWDPVLAAYLVSFEPEQGATAGGRFETFAPGDTSVTGWQAPAPVSWLSYTGLWGDDALPKGAPGQVGSGEFARWTAGPTGPWDKNLARAQICADNARCVVGSNISYVSAEGTS